MAEETSIKRVIKIFYTYVLISKSSLDIILQMFTLAKYINRKVNIAVHSGYYIFCIQIIQYLNRKRIHKLRWYLIVEIIA